MSAVVVGDTGELAGWAGLSIPTFLREILPAIEVGWRLGDRYRGRGYATEAGSAWVDYGVEQLGLDRIVSIYEPHNVASGAVMRRLGYTLERETTHPAGGVPLHVTSLTGRVARSLNRLTALTGADRVTFPGALGRHSWRQRGRVACRRERRRGR